MFRVLSVSAVCMVVVGCATERAPGKVIYVDRPIARPADDDSIRDILVAYSIDTYRRDRQRRGEPGTCPCPDSEGVGCRRNNAHDNSVTRGQAPPIPLCYRSELTAGMISEYRLQPPRCSPTGKEADPRKACVAKNE
jgi:hypothetical protein